MTLSGTQGPPQRRTSALWRRATSFSLSAALVLLSAGPSATQAVAAQFQTGPKGTIPTLTLPTGPVVPAGSVIPGLPSAAQIPALPGSVIQAAGAVLPQAGQLPAAAAGAAKFGVPGAQAGQAPKGASTEALLRSGVEQVAAAQKVGDSAAVAGSLNSLFTGSKQAGDVSASVNAGPAVPAASGLARASLEDLTKLARDAKAEDKDRRSAVKAIADRGDSKSILVLEELGTEKGGSSKDYEIKRLALRTVAEKTGKVLSLPEVSDDHAAELLKHISENKPEAAAFDYDGTVEPSGKAASEETGEALKGLIDSGVETMVLTDRAAVGRRQGDTGILDSVSTLTPEQRAGLTIGAQRGARIIVFDADDKPVIVEQAASWSASEKVQLVLASEQVSAEFGSALVNGAKNSFTEFDFALYLPQAKTDADAERAAELMRQALEKRNLKGHVVPRRKGPGVPGPYITVSKYDKSLGMGRFLALREKLERLRDLKRVPAFLRGALGKVLGLLRSRPVPAAGALVVGDRMMGERGIDMAMVLPGALGIAVGGSADPRLDNVFVWNKQGHAGAMEIARAAAGPKQSQMPGMNWKAFGGLMTARSLSIIAFLATTLAYAKIAIGAVGLASFGTLSALGGLVAVAAGPLTGRIAAKMSPRAGMALNALLRAVFLLNLPLFMAFGAVNFGTLLFGAIANAWVLSSTMTMEGAYVPKMFGIKNVRTMGGLLMVNYFGLQIIFGLILGIGKLVDGHNLMIPFYIASAVNAAVIPLLWWTLPKGEKASPSAASAAPSESKPSPLKAVAGFFKTYWKEAALFLGSFATFPLWHSAIPVALALTYWITRTPVFLKIKSDKPLLGALGLVALGAFVLYGLQVFALPAMAGAIAGKASSLLLGQMMGALFLGQMVSSSSMLQLPVFRVPFLGRVPAQNLVKGLVLSMVAAFSLTGLFPGSILAALAVTGVAGAMMWFAHKLTDKGWISLAGVGLSTVAIPAILWGTGAIVPALLAALAMFGYFYGPASVAVTAYIQKRAPAGMIPQVMGIYGSLLNAGISLGIGTFALLSTLLTPQFPALLWALFAVAVGAAAAFYFGSKKLPGLPQDSFHQKGDKK
jgi:hypothetical protein